MARFVARRLLYSIPVLLGILFVTFLLARVIPGDPCRAVLGERATDQICDAYMERKGLNEPIYTQFGIYIKDVFTGDLGESFRYGRPVTTMLVERLPVTIELSHGRPHRGGAGGSAGWGSSRATSTTRRPTWSPWWGPTSGSPCRSSGWA